MRINFLDNRRVVPQHALPMSASAWRSGILTVALIIAGWHHPATAADGVAAGMAGVVDDDAALPVPPASGQGAPLNLTAAIVLGVVEGVTEFLPVSSTGHLILTNHVLDIDRNVQARDQAGNPLWLSRGARTDADNAEQAPTPAVPYTVKAAADDYAIVIQFGAILAVAILYWRPILSVFAGLVGRDPAGLRLLRNLVIAFLPAAVLGLALHDWIDAHLFSVSTVVAALVVGAVFMLIVSRWQRNRARHTDGAMLPDPAPSDLTAWQALVIGLLQCVAMWPGMSRSMMTLVGGYLVGLRPVRAAEFSFLLGLVTLTAAASYQAWGSGGFMVRAFGAGPLALGVGVAAVSAAIAVRWMVAYLNRHGLALFAWYRLALAAAVVIGLAVVPE